MSLLDDILDDDERDDDDRLIDIPMATADQKVERLTCLRHEVEAWPEELLHMRAFHEKANKPHDCRSAYCAAGLAAAHPWFRRHTEINQVFSHDPHTGEVAARSNSVDFIAIALGNIFGLDAEDAAALFAFFARDTIHPHAVSRQEVIANIDRLLRGERAQVYPAIEATRHDEDD